jgi:hypothetical protein
MIVAETVVLWPLVSTTCETRSEVANRSVGVRLVVVDAAAREGQRILAAQSAEWKDVLRGRPTRSDKEVVRGRELEPNPEAYVPLSVREARRARKLRDDLWSYVWVNFMSVILLFTALAIACYRVGAQSCH